MLGVAAMVMYILVLQDQDINMVVLAALVQEQEVVNQVYIYHLMKMEMKY